MDIHIAIIGTFILAMSTSAFCQTSGTNQTSSGIGNSSCAINLANDMTTNLLRHYFRSNTSGGTIYMVYFRLKYTNSTGSVNVFNISNNDTFEPDLWVWAAGKGKNLLRLPLDYRILSLGLLTIQSADMEITFDAATYSCLRSLPPDTAINGIGKFISENITANESSSAMDNNGPIICRSVYAFKHVSFGKKGIGFDCCAPSKGSETIYICDQSYSEAFAMIWYGPIVLMCFIYLIGIIHFYKLYKNSFQQAQVRHLAGFHKTVEEIKMDVFNRIVTNTEKWVRIQTPEALIALRESCSFLDVLGMGRRNHSFIVIAMRVVFACALLIGYYGIWGMFLRVYYEQLGSTIERLKDSQEVYLNVLGHMGWIFSKKSLGIYYYSIFEFIYTAVVPFFALYSYASIWTKKKVGTSPNAEAGLSPTIKCFFIFSNSACGIVLQYLTLFLTFIHFVFLGGVFLSYLIYLVGLGVFANIDVVSPWIIPIALFLHFFSTAFDPVYAKYKSVKDSLFNICFEDFKHLIIKQNKEMFLPRDLIENFYVSNSRSLLYTCFLKVFWVITLLLLLLLVVLTLQYPYNTKLTSIVPFLGVQVVFILPYLAKVMYVNNQISPLEETILRKDLRRYVKQYMKERPELKVPEPETNAQEDDGRASVNENGGIESNGTLGIDTNALVTVATDVMKKIKY